ncbi:3-beta hydroxysteroid dehydrogenase [Paenibacillus elgii]|uniref:3-beta hydroxysteroid dehydrogenase n=1 Tax=Paenibacillus elgii TaxID=189691 RepID=A0A163Z7I9_9BACL|nr:NAD(P)-dependent oxidoreductase [Paenibacillus elgii]KZE81193.1 3-beta hydroxysteroid dehydrogenase [Paenibacillus elgii]
MKIALVGATGTIGQRILEEALSRGHQVTAIVRDPARVTKQNENLKAVAGDVFNADSLAAAAAGHDIVISAYGPAHGQEEKLAQAAQALVDAAKKAGVSRLLTVGGAGSLEVAPGVQLVDTPEFPAEWKGIALAHRDALEVYRRSELDWTNLSPAALIQPGEKTGQYRTEENRLVTDAEGNSRISAEDYAVAMLDEAERPRFSRKRFTVGY